ncbi:uncharacterized protein HaLaN_23430 [Haematococcus lacustris]|uniref:Uncharacterized protein n=1 Tax=Haematococcus lacustris TaxID=44745 RepID=A0A6A0A4F1_HAELA|nr:uncharacterized protein HaLaN_23430 [Haematococcus lacustris]
MVPPRNDTCVYFSAALCRMVYAFSRDGAMLGSRWWRQLNPKSKQPVAGVWFMSVLCFFITLLAVYLGQVNTTITSIFVVSLHLSYGRYHFHDDTHMVTSTMQLPCKSVRVSLAHGMMVLVYDPSQLCFADDLCSRALQLLGMPQRSVATQCGAAWAPVVSCKPHGSCMQGFPLAYVCGRTQRPSSLDPST